MVRYSPAALLLLLFTFPRAPAVCVSAHRPPMTLVRCDCGVCLAKNGWQPRLVNRATLYEHRKNHRAGASAGAGPSSLPLPYTAATGTSVAARTRQGNVAGATLFGAPPPADGPVTTGDGERFDGTAGSPNGVIDALGTGDYAADGVTAEDDEEGQPVEDGNALQTLRRLEGLGVNGVRFSKVQFTWAIDDFVGFVFATNHHLTREAVAAYLLQRGTRRHSSTPHQLNKLVQDAVHLCAIPVSCCPAGCMAFTGGHATAVSCAHCGRSRYRPASSVPTRIMPYWPITPWLRMMLLDEDLSRSIFEATLEARLSAS